MEMSSTLQLLRIWRRYNSGKSKSTRPPTNRMFTDSQEDALIAWIGVLDGLEISARANLITASANQLLRDGFQGDPSLAPVVGAEWTKNFIKRHEELHFIKQKSRELSRMTLDWSGVNWFFLKLRKVIEKHGILPDDIWNVDEAGFRVGIGGRQWIVTRCTSRDAHLAAETCRDSVTCIEAVSAAGQHIEAMVIMSAAQHSEAWVDNTLEDETLFVVSPNGYTDDIIALRWIKHFANRTKNMTKGSRRLLIFDGHGSHCTKQFLSVCEENNIIPFSLPPHSSHVLQPLDVSVFQPYKHWHREAVDAATRTGCTNFTKTGFLAALNDIRIKALKPNTIKNGFRLTGIYPLRPDEVLKKFAAPKDHEAEAEQAGTSSQQLSSPPHLPATPRTIRSIIRTAHAIQENYELSPTTARYVKGTLQNAQSGSLAIQALSNQTAAQQERNKRNERQRKVTQSGGVLHAFEAREIAAEKLEQEKLDHARREWTKVKREAKLRGSEGWSKLYTELCKAVKHWEKDRDAREQRFEEARARKRAFEETTQQQTKRLRHEK
ncbi:hypothetical protein CF336_g6238 [Tilletia laevis]|uniref:Uncharacterized protein n=2 Tax=Tilletia caries TaxID=13290 RepID=A0A177U2S7_9BASI|nr:hypothetical protein CF336_g6238 [Tilletia laevis]KAE8192928.1 hypothetical protein CF335_g5719 [Tilletia laevis]KAE8250253.1 hypothetical protein A4X03_0g6486 [Tilletia caries]